MRWELQSYWDTFCFWSHVANDPRKHEMREVNEAWAMWAYLMYVKHGGRGGG